jgi:hypothetical protein
VAEIPLCLGEDHAPADPVLILILILLVIHMNVLSFFHLPAYVVPELGWKTGSRL